MAAHRTDGFIGAMSRIRNRGGFMGCKFVLRRYPLSVTDCFVADKVYYIVYQGLIPWVSIPFSHNLSTEST